MDNNGSIMLLKLTSECSCCKTFTFLHVNVKVIQISDKSGLLHEIYLIFFSTIKFFRFIS